MAAGPSTPLIDRIAQRKRVPLADRSNDDATPLLRRRLHGSNDVDEEDAIDVQRFTLVSRGAPPARRAPARHSELLAPLGLAAQLGQRIQVCRCSECPGSSKQRRLCRRDTECHTEYALLLSMNSRFEVECPTRCGNGALVTEACCREKSAYFILGPSSTTVGYVAAVVEANRKLPGRRESGMTREMGVSGSVPSLLQIYVEPEYRRQGLARAALTLLLRGHDCLIVDDPPWFILRMLESLGFKLAGAKDTVQGRPLVLLARSVEAGLGAEGGA